MCIRISILQTRIMGDLLIRYCMDDADPDLGGKNRRKLVKKVLKTIFFFRFIFVKTHIVKSY